MHMNNIKLFNYLNSFQLIAQLYHDIAYDYDFLLKCHENVIQTDPFTKGLIDILKAVKEQGNYPSLIGQLTP